MQITEDRRQISDLRSKRKMSENQSSISEICRQPLIKYQRLFAAGFFSTSPSFQMEEKF